MNKLTFLLFCLGFVSSALSQKIYKVKAETAYQKNVLFQLSDNGTYEFLTLSKIPGHADQVAVKTYQIEEFEKLLSIEGITFNQFKDNVLPPTITLVADNQSVAYDKFYSSFSIENSIKRMSDENNADECSALRSKIWQYGSTDKGLPLFAIRIGLKENDEDTIPVVLGDAGIHGNEWIGPISAHKIIENLFHNATALKILEKVDVIFTACVNRDGYEASLGRSFNLIFGRKNQMASKVRDCAVVKNQGTNINRNFDWYWDSSDSREDPCNYNYRGDYPNSAPETASLVRLMKTPNVVFYYTIHSFGNLLLYPYGQKDVQLENLDQVRTVALEGQKVLQKQFGQKYIVGTTFDVLYITTGASKDYAAGVEKIPISLIHEIGGEPMDFKPRLENIGLYSDMAWCSFEAMTLKTIEVLNL